MAKATNLDDIQTGEWIELNDSRVQIAVYGSGVVTPSYRKKGVDTWLPLNNTISAGDVDTERYGKCEIKLDFPGTITLVTADIYVK